MIRIIPPQPTPGDNIVIELSGTWPDGCVPSSPVLLTNGSQIIIATSNPGQVCIQVLTPWQLIVPVGQLSAGGYQVTVTYSQAGGSPIVIGNASFTVGLLAESEPNDSPSQATPLPVPTHRQSASITGDATLNDTGVVVNQLSQECGFREAAIHDWFQFALTQPGAFQASLSFAANNADYDLWLFRESRDAANFPQGVQLVAFSTQGTGFPETIPTRVLESGVYFIGVMRFPRNDDRDSQRITYTLTLTHGLSPERHAIDDVTCVGFYGPETGVNGFWVVNRVRPTQYPARLESISALFFAHPNQSSPNGQLVRFIAFMDPTGSGIPPANPIPVVDQPIAITLPSSGQGRFNTLNLGAGGPVISSGDFYVGYVVDSANGIFPDAGRVLFPGIRSLVSPDGGRTYQSFDLQRPNLGLNLTVAIRALVNTAPFEESISLSPQP